MIAYPTTGPQRGPVVAFWKQRMIVVSWRGNHLSKTIHRSSRRARWKTQFDKTCAKKALYVALYGLLDGRMIQ